ncbi:MAG: bifunctional (p)ppGpp synthetase/guanosine-3',5'-bis(diphosphate) 3'-pyrophosphohydrolase [Saprospiraceae bacterium]|nr:MAG: bifunctional (p)ppGpp synthetase/guanosine-3',5'-bis(diphosphate) 3'-pyrophosphohydrolase [Saprospiraceae bacterium]
MLTATPTMKNEDEEQVINRAYRRLLRTLQGKMDNRDKELVRSAFELAAEAHKKQRRKSGEPYILHPIEVARISIEEIGLGPTAAICALLHDVVEDTDITLEKIRQQFGDKIALIVDGLTKLDSSAIKDIPDRDSTESPQAENFRKVLSTLVIDVRVVLIKMADRLHNMRTLGAMPRHKQLKIAAETSYIYAPLAHRLGLYNIRSEFEDLCLKITEPEAYEEINHQLNVTQSERARYINEFLKPVQQKLDEIGVPYRCFGRAKSVSSIYHKIKTKSTPFEEIYDLFAVRIVVDVEKKREKSICWMVYSIVTDTYQAIPERLKDWVTVPKSNAYESLHTTVIGPGGRFVEVQIRSERMDEIAERGFAAHWKYKGVSNQPDVYEKWLDQVREIMENPNADALEFISDFKNNLYSEEIYVVTPKGDMINLPKGATALDFAFSIHTAIGYHCRAVKVNNRIVPMGHKLNMGDQVEVITDKNQKPNESWLKIVVTGKARSKIRDSMKEDRRRKGVFGKETLERKFNNMKVNFDQGVDTLVKFFHFNTRVDLYYAIATEEVNLLHALKRFEVKEQKLVEIPTSLLKTPAEPEKKTVSTASQFSPKTKILVNGEPAELYPYKIANCCNPVQGDSIFAFLSSSEGLKIHRTNCPNATNLLARYGYRVMKADWVISSDSTFVADLKITGVDEGVGIIEQLTHKISTELGLNIRSFQIEGGDQGYYEGKISLLVANIDQLNVVMKALRKIESISSVVRIE